MDFAALPSLILAIAQERSLTAVLHRVIEAVASAPEVGLARLWLRQADRAARCALSALQLRRSRCHLRASAGQSLAAGVDWTRTNGTFHRMALGGTRKVSHMASTGESIRVPRLDRG